MTGIHVRFSNIQARAKRISFMEMPNHLNNAEPSTEPSPLIHQERGF